MEIKNPASASLATMIASHIGMEIGDFAINSYYADNQFLIDIFLPYSSDTVKISFWKDKKALKYKSLNDFYWNWTICTKDKFYIYDRHIEQYERLIAFTKKTKEFLDQQFAGDLFEVGYTDDFAGNWIPIIEDCLPDIDRPILVFVGDTQLIAIRTEIDGELKFITANGQIIKPTHWQLLPSKPV